MKIIMILLFLKMASNLSDENIINLVRQQLNSDKIKLWLPPYTQEDGSVAGESPQVLCGN